MPEIPENLTIRRARDGDLPEMARVHHSAYPGMEMTLEETVERFRTNPRISLEDYWVCIKDDRLVGLFALYTFRMYRVGKTINTGGIGSVAVAPESRRDRIGYWMMVKALEVMDQNSIPLTILYPFRHSFYQHLGWGLIGNVYLYNFSPNALPKFSEREHIRPAITQEDHEDVMRCYINYAKRQNGTVQRDDPYWYEVVLKNADCFAYYNPDSNEIEGYLTYRYRPHSHMKSFLTVDIEVWDFVWNSRKALHGLLSFLGSQRDQAENIIFPDQSRLPFEQILSEPCMPNGKRNYLLGAETAHMGANLMGRIVQLRRALTSAGNFGELNGQVTLNIRDDINPKNSEPVTIELNEGKLDFSNKNKSASITLSTDISTFSAIYWGALSLKDAALLGKVEFEGKGDIGFLSQMLNLPKPMCLDHF